MSDYSITITHGLAFRQAVNGLVADLDFSGAMVHDLNIVVGRVQVTLRRAGTQVNDVLAGSLVQTLDTVQTCMGTRQMVTQRDIDSSNGKLRVGDRKFRVERADLTFDPRLGDILTCQSVRHEVIGVDDATLRTAWVLWCRS